MKAQIAIIPREEIRRLISAHDEIRLTHNEFLALDRFVRGSSTVWVGKVDERLMCIFGVVCPTLSNNRAYLWLHTTSAVRDHEFTFVRQSQIAIAKVLELFPIIVGHCEITAESSIRWLRWLGAVFGKPEGTLIPFQIVRTNG